MAALRRSLLITEFDEAETPVLADQMGLTTPPDGEALVAEGDLSQSLLLQAAATIQFYRDRAGNDELLQQMRVGRCTSVNTVCLQNQEQLSPHCVPLKIQDIQCASPYRLTVPCG